MEIKISTIIIGIMTAITSAAAFADAPRYDFADVLYQGISDPSGSGLSSDHTVGVDGSYAMTDKLIGLAAYGHETADVNQAGFSGTDSANSYSLGLGYRIPLTDRVDLMPNLSYLSEHVSANLTGFTKSVSNSGYDAGVQLRAMITAQFELDANIDHTTPGSPVNTVGVTALYNFTSSFAVGLGYANQISDGQTITGWTLALRYYFE
jgi:hypothetical protein